MAEALNVDPVWLLGYDPVISEQDTKAAAYPFKVNVNGKPTPLIIDVYDQLNKENRLNAVMYLNYLLKQQKDNEEGSDNASNVGRS